MAKVTLNDLSKALGLNEKEPKKDFHYYGTIVSSNPEDRTYEVSINRDQNVSVEAARLVGAAVGDTVMVTVMANGYATVTGRLGGDLDATDAQRAADNAADVASSAMGTANSALSNAQQANQAATAARTLAEHAEEEAGRAHTAAEQAAEDASSAATSASQAASSASSANTSAQNAAADASRAAASASSAETDAARASTAATNAESDAASAASNASRAATSASNAEADAASAATSAQNAANDASSAASSASSASTSASNAAASASAAQQEASAATTAANQAKTQAQAAETAANEAKTDANTAKRDAASANAAANGAVASLAITQGVVDALGQDMDDMQTHVAMMDAVGNIPAGLHVVPSSGGYFMVIANDGVYVYDNESVLVAKYGHDISFDSNREHKIGNNTNYIRYYDANNDGVADSIEVVANNIRLGSYSVADKIAEAKQAGTDAASALSTYKTNNDARVKAVEDGLSSTDEDLANYITSQADVIEDLQNQIDGAIDTWYYSGDPTLSNQPAVAWTTDETKENHLRDLYFNTQNGHSFRFAKEGNTYKWIQIQDADAIKALADAAAAQGTANVKKRVFVTTPYVPYDVGDLWVGGSQGDIKKCKTSKTSSQSYAAADWELASKYTDDTYAKEVENDLHDNYYVKTDFDVAPDKITATVEAAKQAAINDAASKYYNKTETYTKSEIEQKAGEISLSVAQEEVEKVISVKEASGNIVHVEDASEYPALSLKVHITPKQSGTGTPSPDNVRQISGWESVNVTDAGKNLLKVDSVNAVGRGVTQTLNEDGTITLSGTSTSNYNGQGVNGSTYTKLPAGTYRFVDVGETSGATFYYYLRVQGNSAWIRSGETFTVSEGSGCWIVLYFLANTTVSGTHGLMIVSENSTYDTFEPYNGHTTTSLGRTVYGGTLDVVSGVLTDKMGIVDLGTLNWMKYGTYSDMDRYVSNSIDSTVKTSTANAICSIYPYRWGANGFTVGSGNAKLSVLTEKDQYASVADFKTAMSGAQLCYELAEPQTYTLTPTEVSTLLGENNVWADAGDVYLKYATMNSDMNALMSKSNADLKITAEGISSEVSKISSAKYVVSGSTGWSLANIKTWAAEGYTTNWNVATGSTDNLRVGDVVYIKGTDATRQCPVYIKVTVDAINSTSQIRATAHGYEDVLPVETIKSTINQSADSVKIAANHVDIEGAAIFSSGRLSETNLSNTIHSNYGYKYNFDIVVYGESNKYYPIYLNNDMSDYGQVIPHEVLIERGYAEQAPSDWNTATHKGGLMLVVKWNYGGWGGATYRSEILAFSEQYSTMVGDVIVGNKSGMNSTVYLRGGGTTGALYHIHSDVKVDSTRYGTQFPYIGTTEPGTKYMESGSYYWSVDNPLTTPNTAHIYSLMSVKEEQYIYISKASGTTSVDPYATWVTEAGDKQNTWTTKRPTYNTSYPVLFVAKQKKAINESVYCTTPVKDDTTTIIDGGHITTGTIDATKVTVTNLNAGNITGGTLNIARVPDDALNSNVNVGGRNLVPNSKYVAPDSNTGYVWGRNKQYATVIPGETYTLSLYYNGERTTTVDHGYAYAYAIKSDGTKISGDYMHSSNRRTRVMDQDVVQLEVYPGLRNYVVGDVYCVKLEKGNKATDWTPAPEDVASDIEDASKIATNYLSFDETNGLDIGYTGKTERTNIKGDGMRIYDSDNTEVASFLKDGALMGAIADAHTRTGTNGFTVYKAGTESELGRRIASINENGMVVQSGSSRFVAGSTYFALYGNHGCAAIHAQLYQNSTERDQTLSFFIPSGTTKDYLTVASTVEVEVNSVTVDGVPRIFFTSKISGTHVFPDGTITDSGYTMVQFSQAVEGPATVQIKAKITAQKARVIVGHPLTARIEISEDGIETFSNNGSLGYKIDNEGSMLLGLDRYASSGTSDYDLYASIAALNWESEVVIDA